MGILLNLSIRTYLHVKRQAFTTCFTEIICVWKRDIKLETQSFQQQKRLCGVEAVERLGEETNGAHVL